LSICMEKYISMWNTTSRAYLSRLSRESKKMGGQDPTALASLTAPPSNGGGILN
jgi:import inner membrane translocase subunit TIM13